MCGIDCVYVWFQIWVVNFVFDIDLIILVMFFCELVNDKKENVMNGVIFSGDCQIMQQELFGCVVKVVLGFQCMGIGEEDVVVIMLCNDFVFFELFMVVNVFVVYVVLVNWYFQQEEVGYIFNDCGVKVIVVYVDFLLQIDGVIFDGVEFFVVEMFDEICDIYGFDLVLCSVLEGVCEWLSWVEFQEFVELLFLFLLLMMIYILGMIGNLKGVCCKLMSDENVEIFGIMISQIFGFWEGEFCIVVIGLMYYLVFNVYGFYVVCGGGFCVLQLCFDEEGFLQFIEEYKIIYFYMVLMMFVCLFKLLEEIKMKYDFLLFEFVVYVVVLCFLDVKCQMIEWWGLVINEYYGLIEIGGVIFYSVEEVFVKLGIVGCLIEGVMVKIYDDEGKEFGVNEIGNVYFVMEGFLDFIYNKFDDKCCEIEIDGMVMVGDVGYFDDDGYFFFCDCKNDMVILGGVNIYLVEIEVVFIGMFGVKDCVVFGIFNEEFGEEFCVYVEVEFGEILIDGGVCEFLFGKFVKYKVLCCIVFQNDLLCEDFGKIFKCKLRVLYWEEVGRSI